MGETKKKSRRTVIIDQERFRVAVGKETFSFEPLPNHVKTWLGLLGLKTALLISAISERETFEALLAGDIPEQKLPPVEKKSKWRTAVAVTMATTRANELNPGSPKRLVTSAIAALMPEMDRKVAALDRATIKRLSERADVQEQYSKLFGAKDSGEQASIFAALEPIAVPVEEEVA